MTAVCALDVGTTRIKALLFDEEALPGQVYSVPSVLHSPLPGVEEVDAEALWAQVVALLGQVAAGGHDVQALVISNQRATAFLVDDAGHPAGPGLSWQDTRGSVALAAWLREVGTERFAEVTGLVPSTAWSVAKGLWWRGQGQLGGARLATVQDWLLHRLGAEGWVLDHANASLTGLMDVGSLAWDDGLVQAAGLSMAQLPVLAPSATRVGRLGAGVARETGLAAGTPLILGGGDQQCAGLVLSALQPGTVAVSLGTAAVASAPVERVTIDPRGRLVCTAHVAPGWWALEGLETAYAAAHAWGRDLIGEEPARAASMAPVGARGLLFFPYLAGEGAPEYDPQARGALVGLTLAHGRADVARAILEGTTVELVRILDAVRELVPVERLVVGGGSSRVPLLREMLADLAGAPVALAPQAEVSLVGAGLLGWVGLGRWPDAATAVSALPSPRELVGPENERAALSAALLASYGETLAGLRRGGVLTRSREAAGG